MAVLMAPENLPFVVLEEGGFVVCDKNEGQRTRGLCKAISVVVPNWESSFVFRCPSMDKFLSICHDIVSLMAVNIHPILHFSVSPIHFCKPSLCR